MTISYNPSKDEMLLKFGPAKGRPTKDLGQIKLWWDKNNNIRAVAIKPYQEELEKFERNLGWVNLRGIWKGIEITEEDIREVRQELLKKLEERWEKW